MNSVWQQLTLGKLRLYQWRGASYLYRLVEPLRAWRQSSLLMQWADQIGLLLLILVFGLAPFVSNALVGVLLLACAIFWVLLTLSDEAKAGFTPIHLLVLLYWGIATVATALSPVKEAAFTGWLKLTLYLLFFALMARVLRSPRLRSFLITLYLHVALIVSIYGIRQRIFGAVALATWVDPTSTTADVTRVYSYLGNPNLLGAYLLPAIAFSIVAFFAWKGWLPKALALVMALIHTACLYYTGSRGAWLGFVMLGFTLLALLVHWWSIYLPRFWRTWALPVLLGTAAGGLVLAVLFVDQLRDRVASIFAGRGDSSNNFRINVWTAVIEMIGDHPEERPLPNYVLGIGPGNTAFNKIYPLYQRPRFSALSAYSVLLEIAVETGLIGLTSFLWLLLVTFNQGWTQLQRLRQVGNREGFWLIGAIAILAGMLTHGLVDTVLYRPEINTLWWLSVALVASYYLPAPVDATPSLEEQRHKPLP